MVVPNNYRNADCFSTVFSVLDTLYFGALFTGGCIGIFFKPDCGILSTKGVFPDRRNYSNIFLFRSLCFDERRLLIPHFVAAASSADDLYPLIYESSSGAAAGVL